MTLNKTFVVLELKIVKSLWKQGSYFMDSNVIVAYTHTIVQVLCACSTMKVLWKERIKNLQYQTFCSYEFQKYIADCVCAEETKTEHSSPSTS